MSASPFTLQSTSLGVPHGYALELIQAPRLREERIRRRAGAAWARIQASGQALAVSLGVDPSSITHWKKGEGSLATTLLRIDRLERAGHDTTPLLEALIEVQLTARGETRSVCPMQLVAEEDEADREEDAAQTAYLTGTGSKEAWCGSVVRYVARAIRTVRCLGGAL